MPTEHKLCTFDCIYCECGFNTPVSHPTLPTRQEVREALEQTLQKWQNEPNKWYMVNDQMVHIDVLTFSGNGEPTLHPDFLGIIEDTCALRDRYCPNAKVSVLSNSTQLGRQDVRQALMLCDNRILKLDSAIDETMRLIDQPVNANLTVQQITEWLAAFNGDFTLQTCFLRGTYHQHNIDNTQPTELAAWYEVVRELHPKQVMIYVIDRATPVPTLEKISREQMDTIAAPLRADGFDVIVCA